MEFSPKMDSLTLVLFILSIFVFPLFILFLIHIIMMKYVVKEGQIEIKGLIKNIEIKYENIILIQEKTYEGSLIAEDFNSISTALGNIGVMIEYQENEEKQQVFISPSETKRFLKEVSKFRSSNAEVEE